jgi:hypothetical protein
MTDGQGDLEDQLAEILRKEAEIADSKADLEIIEALGAQMEEALILDNRYETNCFYWNRTFMKFPLLDQNSPHCNTMQLTSLNERKEVLTIKAARNTALLRSVLFKFAKKQLRARFNLVLLFLTQVYRA